MLLVALSPWAGRVDALLWGCAFKHLTGVACPTCGTTRAAMALARLDVITAFTHYPLAALGWSVLIGGGLVALGLTLAGRTPPAIPTRLSPAGRVALVAVILANWVYSIATGV